MDNILILSAGRRVSLVKGFQDALAGRGGGVIAADMRPELSAACQIADVHFTLPHCLDEKFTDALQQMCREQKIAVVIPTIDTELAVLSAVAEEFQTMGTTLLVSDSEIISQCRDKRKTAAFLSAYGLSVPVIYPADAIEYPAFVKPYDGSRGIGAQLLSEAADLTDSIRQNPKNMFCQYIDHAEHTEFTCDLYFDKNSNLKCVLPRQRLEVRDGEVSKAKAVKNEIVEELFENFNQVKGIRGCVNIQLMRHNETHQKWYIEMNPRFGGGYPLSRLAGADFQAWIVDEYISKQPIAEYREWQDGLTMLRYDAEVLVNP